MTQHLLTASIAALLFGIGCTPAPVVVAGTAPAFEAPPGQRFAWAAAVVCATEELPKAFSSFSWDTGAKERETTTSVRITNPSDQRVDLQLRAVITPPSGPSNTSSASGRSLEPFGGVEVGCGDFVGLQTGGQAGPSGGLLIHAASRLGVSVEYEQRLLLERGRERLFRDYGVVGLKNVFGAPEDPPAEPNGMGLPPEVELLGEETAEIQGLESFAREEDAAEERGLMTGFPRRVRIPIKKRPETATAAAMGLAGGAAASHAIGIGVGGGTSIDVEYIEPTLVPAPGGP